MITVAAAAAAAAAAVYDMMMMWRHRDVITSLVCNGSVLVSRYEKLFKLRQVTTLQFFCVAV